MGGWGGVGGGGGKTTKELRTKNSRMNLSQTGIPLDIYCVDPEGVKLHRAEPGSEARTK